MPAAAIMAAPYPALRQAKAFSRLVRVLIAKLLAFPVAPLSDARRRLARLKNRHAHPAFRQSASRLVSNYLPHANLVPFMRYV
jgi:hypothetical protein